MGLYRRPHSPYWWMRIPRVGRPTLRESTKIPVDAPTAAERAENRQLAQRAFLARMGDLARDRYHLPKAKTSSKTFSAWAAWYDANVIATHRGADRERGILAILVDAFGPRPLTDLTREAVAEWVTLRAKSLSPRTVNREVDLLKAILRSAVEHGQLEASPIAGMKRLHTVQPKRRLLTPDEERRLLAAMERAEDRALLIMGLDTLCRLGDCLDLRWEDVKKDRLWIRDPKVGGGFWQPMTTRLRDALDEAKDEGAQRVKKRTKRGFPPIPGQGVYVFAWRRRHETENGRRNGVRQMLEHACRAAGIPFGKAEGGITWHWATRRTAATRMLQAGVDLATVQRAGRWKDPQVVLGIYADSDDERVRKALGTINRDGQSEPDKGPGRAA